MSIICINPYQVAASAPPTDPDFADVQLLLHGDGADGSTTITDSSPSPKAVTAAGAAQISTAQSKFGGASIAFDGTTTSYLNVPPSISWDFSSGPRTVELWLRLNSLPPPGFSCRFICVGQNNQSASLVFSLGSDALVSVARPFRGSTGLASGSPLSINTWHHIAFVLNGINSWIFVDGIGTNGALTMPTGTAINYLRIGYDPNTPTGYNIHAQLDGYIDDLRITRGVARYTSNFTPPTAPFPDA